MRYSLLFLTGILLSIPSFASPVSAPSFPGCPVQGDTHNPRIAKLNLLKNRSTAPKSYDPHITLKAMMAPGNDLHRWSDSEAGKIKGYVVEVKRGGKETVNCHAGNAIDQDTHIEIALTPHPKHGHVIIAEVTPGIRAQMKAKGIDWSTENLKKNLLGHYVEIGGWMFNDLEHTGSSFNDNPTNKHDWRQSSEEIHPIDYICVLDSPKNSADSPSCQPQGK